VNEREDAWAKWWRPAPDEGMNRTRIRRFLIYHRARRLSSALDGAARGEMNLRREELTTMRRILF
jgi:hypothetical protein